MYNNTNIRNEILTLGKLNQIAPSIFASQEREGLSSKYNFIPTIEVVKELENEGWLPVKAMESRVRNEVNQGYQKHMVRFRSFNERIQDKLMVGDSFIELVLTNSHNGLSSFIFNLGLFRLACSNGLVVSEGSFDSAHIRHNSYDAKKVLEICSGIVQKAPVIISDVEKMQAIDLTPSEQIIFAESAKQLRFDNPNEIDTDRVLRPRRMSDSGNDLWRTFNRTQENLTKGGILYSRYNESGRYTGTNHTREVKAIDNNIKLNQALWVLAERMAELKNNQIPA